MMAFMTLVMVSLLVTSVSCDEDLGLRLSGGRYVEAGYLEVWRGGQWGLMCGERDSQRLRAVAEVVCRQLGYTGVLEAAQGDTQHWTVARNTETAAFSLECGGQEGNIGQCQTHNAGCSRDNVMGVLCRPESKSACGPGSYAMLGSCYSLNKERRTFTEAQADCQRSGGSLLEISSSQENIMVGMIIESFGAAIREENYWTGGIVNEVLGKKLKIWHGSQKPFDFDNNMDIDQNKHFTEPQGIIIKPDRKLRQPKWVTAYTDSKFPFICKFPQSEIGCLSEDDPYGSKYVGPASHDKNGEKCGVWGDSSQGFTDNLCRNPDGNDVPYCYLESGGINDCDIPRCDLVKPQETVSKTCNQKSENNQNGKCFKEEFSCRNGDCVSKDYVCDGATDCADGSDEEGCRQLSSLFDKETGFKLEGITADVESESVSASVEECAKLCLYQKGRCCNSFSHRAADNSGKGDRCILNTVYTNELFDATLEKKSWDYYELNFTDTREGRKCISERGTMIQGLRLRNRQRGGPRGNLVQVKIEDTREWGGICDDGLNINGAHVICQQMGYPLGAEDVVKAANVNGKGGRVLLGQVRCDGSEKSLSDCDLSDKVTCHASQMAAVVCKTTETVCKDDEFQCRSGECVPISGLCDGNNNNCRDNSDENPQMCNSRTDVRLGQVQEGGNGARLLEVRHKGVWGTVCQEGFSQGEADVFCKMLGYDRAPVNGWSTRENDKEKRSGSWPIWIEFHSSSCDGTETRLEQCHAKSLWEHSLACRHEEDIFLKCENDDSSRAGRPARNALSRNTRQVVERCGLWRALPDITGPVDRIVGGAVVRHGTIPWQASIRLRGAGNKTYHNCGAAVITPFHVLTAAHCVFKYRDQFEIYYVRVGDNVMELEDEEEQELSIERIDFHEDFDVGAHLNNDIAVVHIDKRLHPEGIVFGDKVLPVCLPQIDADYSPQANVTVSGWGTFGAEGSGSKSGSNFVSELHTVSLPVIEPAVCRRPEVYGGEKVSTGMFCAGLLEGGLDTCQGDSGGPAVSYNILPETRDTRATLMGLVSWGYGCGRENKPGVYTKVSKYVDWIHDKVTPDL